MPIYEYQCSKCDTEFEELILSANDKIACPKCGSRKVRKLASTFAHRTKGAGGEVSRMRSAASDSCGGCTSSSCSHCSSR